MNYVRLFLVTCTALFVTATTALAVDLNEGFEGDFPPPGWSVFTTNQGSLDWYQSSTAENSGIYGARSDEEVLGASSDTSRHWLVTPPLVVDNVADEISFWVRTLYSFVPDDDSLRVLVSTTDTSPASFTDQLAVLDCGQNGDFINVFQQFTYNLSAYVGQTIYVAFVHEDPGPGDGSIDSNELYFDDVVGPEVQAPPFAATDPVPGDGAVAVPNTDNLTWTNGAGTVTLDLYLALSQDSIDNNEPFAKKLDNVAAVELYDPPADLEQQVTYYWKIVSHNAFGSSETPVWTFSTAGTPLAGPYDVAGGDNDFATITDAVGALLSSGVSAAVTFNVYGGDHDVRVHIVDPIVGASAINTVTFFDASGTARITYPFSLDGVSDGAVEFDNTSWIVWDGIDIVPDSAYKCLTVKSGASNNTFQNCTFEGIGQVVTSVAYSAYSYGNDCMNNLFDNVRFTSAIRGISLVSTGGSFEVMNCSFDNIESAVYLSSGPTLDFHDNDVQPGYAGNSSESWGFEIGTSFAGTADIYDNEFHNFQGSSTTENGAIFQNGGGSNVVNIYNNFIYDWNLSGSGDAIGIFLDGSGTTNVWHNSIYIDDTGASGETSCIRCYGFNSTETIQNNIMYNGDPDATVCNSIDVGGSLSQYNPETVSNNAYYGGANPNYLVMDLSGFTFATVAEMQADGTYGDGAVEGNPGYLSATDLHIDENVGIVSNGGTPIGSVTTDIDGEARSGTPDIGADEYLFLAPPNDYRVVEIIGVQTLNPELSVVNIDAWIQNIGSAAQVDVPVRLFYNGAQEDEVLVSLTAEESDTITFTWNTPAAPVTADIEVQSFLAGDVNPDNDSMIVADVQIVGQPMSGSYDLGGGNNDYADFASVQNDLTLRGIDGAVTVNVYAATYPESFSLGEVDGISAVNTITFTGLEGALDEPPVLEGAVPVLELVGTDYFTWDNIDITATSSGEVVEINGGADFNTITNSTITGQSLSSTLVSGIETSGGDNDNNTFSNNTLTGSYYGIYLGGSSSSPDVNTVVTGNHFLDGRKGVYATYQDNAQISDNDIEVGYDTNTSECWGIELSTHSSDDTTWVFDNLIHNFRTSSSSNGIESDVGSGYAVFYNNMIYDWQVTGGTVRGINHDGDDAAYYHNTVYVNDLSGATTIQAYYQLGAGTNGTTLMNNVFQVDEDVDACYSIYVSGGTATSDYNSFFGGGTGWVLGYSGGDQGTLLDWQTATGGDANSVDGYPGLLSTVDLHVVPAYNTLDGTGVAIPAVTVDIDGDLRSDPPDIGADEYDFAPSSTDFSVNGFVDVLSLYNANAAVTISVDVQNIGLDDETDVPLRLFYEGAQQGADILVSLLAGERDTIDFSWTVPNLEFDVGLLEAQAFAPGDGFADNDSMTTEVTIIGPPMSGTYDLGGGDLDFENFSEAVSSLNLRGIDGAVIIDCYEGTYNETLVLTEIAGANFVDRVTFQAHSGALDDIVTLTESVENIVVFFDGADFITFDGIDVTYTGDTEHAFRLENGATFIEIKNSVITGPDDSDTGVEGISIDDSGNDNLTVDGCTITGCAYGIRYNSGSNSVEADIRNNLIDGANYCVYLDDLHNGRVYDNELMPKTTSAISANGVYCASIGSDDTCYVYRNEIHNIRNEGTSSPDLNGVNSAPSSGTVYIFNNFIYDHSATGGSSDITGCYLSSGTQHAYHNSILISDLENVDDVSAFELSSSLTDAHIINNIGVVQESTLECASIFLSSSSADIIESNYNAFYGTGALYAVGQVSTTQYATLGDWQGLGYDANSVFGDPGFTSAMDLHILNTVGTVSNLGTPLAEVTDDFDGDIRGPIPDIGADEYDFLAPPDDYSVVSFVDLQAVYPQLSNVSIDVAVTNRGSDPQVDVPVKLFWEGAEEEEILVSLASEEVDTITFTWATPAAPFTGTLEAQCFLVGDADLTNDSVTAEVTVTLPPMNGPYDIGGGNNDYATFTAAIDDMLLRTIDGAVTFNVYDNTYNESILIPEIPGASALNTVTFRDQSLVTLPPVITGTAPVVNIDNGDYITWEGIDVVATGTGDVFLIENFASNNTLLNFSVEGTDVSSSSNYGVYIDGDGCDNNLVDGVTVSGAYYAIRCYGSSGDEQLNNEVRNCNILECKYGLYLYYQEGGLFHDNDIQVGWDGASTTVYGVYSYFTDDAIEIYNNKIHNFRNSSGFSDSYGIYAYDDALMYNNMIYDFNGTGGHDPNGIYISSTAAEAYFNSIYIDDVATTGNVYGIYMSSSSSDLTANNNIIVVDDPVEDCYGVYMSSSSGTYTGDNNAFYGSGAAFNVGYNGGAQATLLDWQTVTSQDAASVVGDPGFVSDTDLHIQPSFSLVDGAGVDVVGITEDIDGDLRQSPPDIGADEYDASLPAPTELTVIRVGATNDVQLDWTAVVGANSYIIYAGDTHDFVIEPAAEVATVGTNTYTHVDAVLDAETIRFYVVVASSDAPPAPALRMDRGTQRMR